MATITEQLASIQSSKAAIKQAIIDKGVACDDVLSSYATRITSIPSPKIQYEKQASRADLEPISEMSYIVPDSDYDAMRQVVIKNDVWTCELDMTAGNVPKIASGVSFSFNTVSKENLRSMSLYGYREDYSKPEFTANIALNSYKDKYFILYGYEYSSDDSSVVEKLWLAEYTYNGQYAITITVKQEIPINSAQ